MIDLNGALAQEFLADCREHLAAMETEILALKMGGSVLHEESLDRIFRTARAIGGPAAYFELIKINQLASKIEALVTRIRSGHALPTAAQSQVLLSASDCLRELIENPSVSNETDTSGVLARLSADDPAAVGAIGNSPAAPVLPRALRILLAEDDFACRLLLQTYLSRFGQCDIAVNGKEAVEAFRAALNQDRSYNLICMDIMMPEMDGREAVRQIRALEEAQGTLSTFGAKIFMTTTVQEVKEVFLCFMDLCDAYLMKPIDLRQLKNQMRAFQLIP
jgi:two-component system chemotaxis response regulator CheY